MDLLLKRNEVSATLGTRYDLFAKLDLKAQELSHIRKTRPEKIVIMDDDPAKARSRWRWCLIPGAIAAIIVTAILGLLFSKYILFFWLPISAILWMPCTKLIFNQVRPFVTVADLITGRTIRCKSLDDLYAKEGEIRQKVQQHMNALADMDSLGSVQRIPLKPE
jgi:hypothetical protein